MKHQRAEQVTSMLRVYSREREGWNFQPEPNSQSFFLLRCPVAASPGVSTVESQCSLPDSGPGTYLTNPLLLASTHRPHHLVSHMGDYHCTSFLLCVCGGGDFSLKSRTVDHSLLVPTFSPFYALHNDTTVDQKHCRNVSNKGYSFKRYPFSSFVNLLIGSLILLVFNFSSSF